jgi:hypothetical protein
MYAARASVISSLVRIVVVLMTASWSCRVCTGDIDQGVSLQAIRKLYRGVFEALQRRASVPSLLAVHHLPLEGGAFH